MVIIAGGGVNTSGATKEVMALAEKKNCPIVCTMMGLGSVPASDPHVVGMLGTYGNQEANDLIRQSDVILAIGTRFDDRIINAPNLFAPDSFVIHVDVDPAEIGKNIVPDIPIVGDAKQVMLQLEDALQRKAGKVSSAAAISNRRRVRRSRTASFRRCSTSSAIWLIWKTASSPQTSASTRFGRPTI